MSNGRSFRRRLVRQAGALTISAEAPPPTPRRPRPTGLIAYGARCTWFGPKEMVAALPSGLPCCPHCHGVLFEVDAETFWNGADRFEREGRDRYVAFLRWLQGREAPCRPFDEFDALYREFLDMEAVPGGC